MSELRELNHRFQFVSGTFDMDKGRLICIPLAKDKCVDLCIEGPMHISFAKIKMYSRDRFVDAEATFESASKLGNEIADRWNNRPQDRYADALEVYREFARSSEYNVPDVFQQYCIINSTKLSGKERGA